MDHAFGVERPHETNVIHMLRQVWVERRHFDSTLAVFLELPGGRQQRRIAIGELAWYLAEALRKLLALVLLERRFRIECIDMAGSADHIEKDDGFGFRREMRRLGRERIHPHLAESFTLEQILERQRTEPVGGARQHVAARHRRPDMFRGCRQIHSDSSGPGRNPPKARLVSRIARLIASQPAWARAPAPVYKRAS